MEKWCEKGEKCRKIEREGKRNKQKTSRRKEEIDERGKENGKKERSKYEKVKREGC